jgi:hypothetical protein
VFTNEKSQHLLLNQDLIFIALNCLEYCESISIEAQNNLSRLISIIFKFPQVQEKLNEKVVDGLIHLLDRATLSDEVTDMMKYTIIACTYISQNFAFITSEISLLVLRALTSMLDRVSDRNLIFAISNLLKGRSQNCSWFLDQDGPTKLMECMLKKDCPVDVLEMCIAGVKQFADQKSLFVRMMKNPDNIKLLPLCLKKCMQVSDSWHECTTELQLYKKVFSALTLTEEGRKFHELELAQKRKRDVENIMTMTHVNIDDLKTMEMLEKQTDVNVKMAPTCKIRNHCFHTAAAFYEYGFDFLLEDCLIMDRVMSDL